MDVFVGLQKLDRERRVRALSPTTRSSTTARWRSAGCAPRTASSTRRNRRSCSRCIAHKREQKIKPGEIVPLEIEIWPSGTRFEAGETLRLIVQGDDINRYSKEVAPVYFRHEASVNRGRHVIHSGGRLRSHLLVPVIPI